MTIQVIDAWNLVTSLFEYRVPCRDGKAKVFEDLDTCGKFYFFLLQSALKLNCLKYAQKFHVIFAKLKHNQTIDKQTRVCDTLLTY